MCTTAAYFHTVIRSRKECLLGIEMTEESQSKVVVDRKFPGFVQGLNM